MLHKYLLAPFALLLLASPRLAHAQTGGVGIGTTTPNAAAALEIKSTSQGLLLPRLTLAQRDALTNSTTAPPVAGLVIYQSDNAPGLYAYDGTAWVRLSGDNLGNHTATQTLRLNDNALSNNGTGGLRIDNAGNVGLGTPTPTQKLDVRGNVRLGDNANGGTGAGPAIEWVGPGVNTDPVGIYRVNPANDQSELRVVVGDVADPSDKFVVGRMGGTSTEGGIPTGSFTPNFSVSSTGQVQAPGLGGTGTRVVTADNDGNLSTQALPTDAQQLSLTGQTLALTNGGSVTLPAAAGDNLGNHTATQTLNLNAQRLLATATTSLGDSTAQVELNANVGTQSAALITRSTYGSKYSRVMLSGYGKLPEGTTSANDYGIWATAYRGGGWAGFFSAGSTTTPLRYVGICQNPGYNGTGSAIRIVDGTQGAGRVLTSDANGYGKWQAITAAGGNFNLGSYRLVGNGGSQGLSITSAGYLGIDVTAPYSQLANTASNIVGGDGNGGNSGSLAWAASQSGYVGMFYNANTAANATGLAVKIASNGTNAALDVSQGTTQDAAGATLLRVLGNGNVGIGVATPGSKLDVAGQVRANGVVLTSDQRFKTNVRPIGSALASVLALRGVRYEWNALGVRHGGTAGAGQVGVIAQEVEKIYPELVSTDAEGYKAVNYAQLTPVLLEAIKEQQQQLEALKARATAAEATATQATTEAATAKALAAATLETFEARLRRLEAAGGQARR